MWLVADCIRALEADRARRVYVVRGASSGLVKIGHSGDPDRRIRSLQRSSGESLSILVTMPGGEALEERLHEMFAAHRRHGEWFHPAPEVLEFVKTSKSAVFQEELMERHNAEIDAALEPYQREYDRLKEKRDRAPVKRREAVS